LVLVFSIIFNRLADNGKSYQEATTLHLSNYAEDGFRTLAFAYRILEAAEYEHWNSMFSQAKATIGPERDELLDKVSEMIEKDMILLGAAAVEDKLQKGVSPLSLSLSSCMCQYMCLCAFKFLITLTNFSRFQSALINLPKQAENMAAYW
jgi:hypothetical protein